MSALRQALVDIALGRELPLQPHDDSSLNPILNREPPEPTHDEADVLEWLGNRKDPDGWIIDALADFTDTRNNSRKLYALLADAKGTKLYDVIVGYAENAFMKSRDFGARYE